MKPNPSYISTFRREFYSNFMFNDSQYYNKSLELFKDLLLEIFNSCKDRIKKEMYCNNICKMFEFDSIEDVFEISLSHLMDGKIIPNLYYLNSVNNNTFNIKQYSDLSYRVTDEGSLIGLLASTSNRGMLEKINIFIDIKNPNLSVSSRRALKTYPDANIHYQIDNMPFLTSESVFDLLSNHRMVHEINEFYIKTPPTKKTNRKFFITLDRKDKHSLFEKLINDKHNICWVNSYDKNPSYYASFYISLPSSGIRIKEHALSALFLAHIARQKFYDNIDICLLDSPGIHLFSDFVFDNYSYPVHDILSDASLSLIQLDQYLSYSFGMTPTEKITSFKSDPNILGLLNYENHNGGYSIKRKFLLDFDKEFYFNIAKKIPNLIENDYSLSICESFSNRNNIFNFQFEKMIQGYKLIRDNWLLTGHRYGKDINYVSIPLFDDYNINTLYDERYMYKKCYFQKDYTVTEEYDFLKYLGEINNSNR